MCILFTNVLWFPCEKLENDKSWIQYDHWMVYSVVHVIKVMHTHMLLLSVASKTQASWGHKLQIQHTSTSSATLVCVIDFRIVLIKRKDWKPCSTSELKPSVIFALHFWLCFYCNPGSNLVVWGENLWHCRGLSIDQSLPNHAKITLSTFPRQLGTFFSWRAVQRRDPESRPGKPGALHRLWASAVVPVRQESWRIIKSHQVLRGPKGSIVHCRTTIELVVYSTLEVVAW